MIDKKYSFVNRNMKSRDKRNCFSFRHTVIQHYANTQEAYFRLHDCIFNTERTSKYVDRMRKKESYSI